MGSICCCVSLCHDQTVGDFDYDRAHRLSKKNEQLRLKLKQKVRVTTFYSFDYLGTFRGRRAVYRETDATKASTTSAQIQRVHCRWNHLERHLQRPEINLAS